MSGSTSAIPSVRKCSRFRLPSIASCDDITISAGSSGSPIVQSISMEFDSSTQSKHDNRKSDVDDNNNNNGCTSVYLSKLLDSNELDTSPVVFNDSDSNNFSCVSMKTATPLNGRIPSQKGASSQKKNNRASHSHKPAEIFRKDLISAMKIPDTSSLLHQEYWVMQDPWRIEWEKGVQVPVNLKSIPSINVRKVPKATHGDFRMPRKMVKSCPEPGDNNMINWNILADSTCRYDLDEMDVIWLEEINNERTLMGMQPLDEFSMEQIMEELETQCHENMQIAIQTKEGLGIEYDEDVVCDVCRLPDSEETNEMVFCDGCNLCVHQACYGILKVPEGNWLCRPCSLGIRGSATCIFCDRKGGAMKSTRSGNKWAHVSCALWIPEISIADPDRMEPITKVSHIPSSRWALLCSLCKDRVGACIQCSVKHCVTAYHVTCAIEAKLDMIADYADGSQSDGSDEPVIFRSYCEKHSKNRKDNNSEEEKSDEERRNDRQHRIMELEEEFYTLVKASAVENRLSIPIETAQQVMDYWKLKRKANFNRPLITPKHEEDTALAEAAETNLQRRLRMFTHLRQDLERVRNLCYMIGRREKTKRATVKNMESVFLTQMKLLERRMCHDSNYDTRKMLTTLQTFGQPYVCDLARKESLLLAKTPEWSQPSEVGSSRAATPVQVETSGKNGTEQQVRVSKVDQKNDETASEPLSSELKLKEDSMKVTRNGLYRRNFLSTGRKRDRTAFENNNEKNTLRSTKVESDSHQRKESHERDYVQPRAEPLEQVTSARKMRRAKTQAWTAWRSTGATSSPSAFTVKTDKSTAIGVKYRTASSKAEIPISAEYKRTKVMSEISRSRSKDNGDENMPIERSVDVMERRTSSSRASYKSDEDRLIVKWDSDAVDNPDITVTPGKVHRNKDSSTAVRELRPKRSRTSKLSDGDVTNEKMSNSRRALRPSRDSTDSIKSLRPPKRLAASNAKNELGALVRSCDEDPIDIEEESMSSGQELHKRSSIDDDVTSLRKENIERPEKHLFQKCSYPVDESSVMLSISNIQKDDEDGGYRGDMDESDFETSECSRHKVRCSASTTDNRTKRKFSDNEDSSDFHNFTERRHQKLLPAKRRRLRNQFSRNRGGSTGSLFKGFNDFEDDPTKTSSASRVKKLSIETISADNTVNIEVPKNDKAAGDGQEEGTKPVATTSFVGGQSGEKPATQNLLQSFHLSYRKSYLSGVEYPTALLHNNNIYSSIGMPSMSHIPPPNVFYSSMPPPFSAVWPPLSSEQKPPYAMLYPPHLHGDIGLNKASPPHALPDSTLSPESQQKPASVAIQASDRGDGLNTAHWPVQVNAGTSCEVPTTLPLPAAAEITGENAGALQEHGKKKKKSKKSKKKKKKKKRKHKSSHSQKEDPKSDKQSTTITIHSSGNNSSDGDTSSNYDEYCVEYCSTLPGTSQEEPVLQTDNAKHVEVAPESGHVTKLEECSPDNLSANSTSPEKNVLIEVEAKKSKLLLKIDKTKIVPMPNDQSDTDPSSGSSSEVLNDEDEQQSNNVLSNDENKPFVSPLKLKLCGLKSDRTLRGGVVAREYQILESDASQDEERLQEVGDKENQEVKLSSVAMRAQAALRRLGLTSSTNPPKPRRGLRAASAREELEGDERSASFKSANVSTPKNASELLKDDAESENLESKKRGRTRKTESDEIQIPASSNIASTSSVCQPEVRSVEVSKPIRRSTFPPTSPPPQHPPVRHWKKKKVIEHETSITTDPLQEMAPMQDVVGISAAPALPSSSQPPKQFPSSRTLPSATSFSNSRVAASSSIPNKETPILSSIISSRDSPTCSNMEGAPPIKVKDKPLYGLSVTKRPLNNNIDVEKSNPWKVTRTPPIDGLPPVSPYKFTVTTKYQKKTAASSIHGKDRVAGIGRLLSKGSSNHNQETPEAKSSISDPYEFADFGT